MKTSITVSTSCTVIDSFQVDDYISRYEVNVCVVLNNFDEHDFTVYCMVTKKIGEVRRVLSNYGVIGRAFPFFDYDDHTQLRNDILDAVKG